MDIGKLETYKRALKAHNYAPKTQRVYFKYFRDFFRSFLAEIESLTIPEINGYIAEQEASPAKTILISAAIKAFYELCLERQVRTVKIIRKETQPEILAKKEVLKFIKSCTSLKDKAVFYFFPFCKSCTICYIQA